MGHARNYFINTQLWSSEDQVPVFYFSSFDESWKVGAEGVVGAYWGIWDKNEKLKF
jgi:exo-beta-1,3-glucanase (GH17 family)